MARAVCEVRRAFFRPELPSSLHVRSEHTAARPVAASRACLWPDREFGQRGPALVPALCVSGHLSRCDFASSERSETCERRGGGGWHGTLVGFGSPGSPGTAEPPAWPPRCFAVFADSKVSGDSGDSPTTSPASSPGCPVYCRPSKEPLDAGSLQVHC